MIPLDDIRLYLPKYLSPTSEEKLFEELKQFKETRGSKNYYTSYRHPQLEAICQGDGIKDLLLINLPNPENKPGPAIVVSNTCDIAPENERRAPPSICYCPILKLHKYQEKLLEEGIANEEASHHIDAIRKQKVSNTFYLPQMGALEKESFVFFDKIISCQNDAVSRKDLEGRRLFTLSNFGHYLFLFKLSVHLTRIRDGSDRDIPNFGFAPAS